MPGTGRERELKERQLHGRRRVHEAMAALGGISSPAGSCVWHVVGSQRSVREWAMQQAGAATGRLQGGSAHSHRCARDAGGALGVRETRRAS
jgi:hypothetical protein